MPAFASTPAPAMTLWGTPDTSDERVPGIWHVTTPSHGGFVLSDERQAAMPACLRRGDPFYEEDVDWSLVVLAFADELRDAGDRLFGLEFDLARQTARNWRPDRYASFTGERLEAHDSYVLRRQQAHADRIGEVVVVSASGDWADWVPTGKVGVVGQRLAGVNHLGQPRYEGTHVKGLCDANRYDSRELVNSFASLDVELISRRSRSSSDCGTCRTARCSIARG